MPSAVAKPIALPEWYLPAKTKYDLPWADLSVIDLSSYDEPGGKEKLANQLKDAVRTPASYS